MDANSSLRRSASILISSVLDVTMPRLDGIEAARQLMRSQRPARLVFLTIPSRWARPILFEPMLKRQTGTFRTSSICVTMRDNFPAQTAFSCTFEDFANMPAEPEIISVSG